jgi:hypothetical protein
MWFILFFKLMITKLIPLMVRSTIFTFIIQKLVCIKRFRQLIAWISDNIQWIRYQSFQITPLFCFIRLNPPSVINLINFLWPTCQPTNSSSAVHTHYEIEKKLNKWFRLPLQIQKKMYKFLFLFSVTVKKKEKHLFLFYFLQNWHTFSGYIRIDIHIYRHISGFVPGKYTSVVLLFLRAPATSL